MSAVLLVSCLIALNPGAREDSRAPVAAVESIGLTVGDLTAQVAFFTGALGFRAMGEEEFAGEELERLTGTFGARSRVARLRLGEEVVELTQYLAPEGRPFPADWRGNDRSFQHIAIVVSDMDRAYAHLRRHRVRHASPGPQRLPDWNPNAGGISAFYFKSPEGHPLELIHFPPGKGDERWQAPTEGLFLGIDHTAIVVGDTDESLRFYRDVLGMTIAGESENHGIEQERLNNVFGARLRITALRAERGPGVELLEYLAPSGGRPYPHDARAPDLVNWHITLVAPAIEELETRLREARTTWVSPGLVPAESHGAAMQVRDPDGHALRFVRREWEGRTARDR